jgi:hypothetical protein
VTSGDWIALGSVLVSIVAFALASVAYRQQKRVSAAAAAAADRAQATTDEQNLNDLIEKIQEGLAKISQAETTFKLEGFAAENSALAALQGQALEARRLARRPGIELDWFQNMALAYAFSQVWDPAGAIEFWDRAVDGARTSQAHIRSLAARAEFYYNRGLGNDFDLARKDYGAALDELEADADGQGPDLVAQQAAGLLLTQAGFEFNIGNDEMAVGLAAGALLKANGIGVTWRRLRALDRAGYLLQDLQNRVIPAREILRPVAAELGRRGIGPDEFPSKTAALLSVPPDGSQLTGLFGAES